jgi:hypothetical protein
MPAARRRVSVALGVLASAALVAGLTSAPTATVAGATQVAKPTFVEHVDGVRIEKRKARVVTGAASSGTAYAGSRIRISGSAVTAPRRGLAKPRKVVLAERVVGGWRDLATARSNKVGAWSMVVDAGAVAEVRTFRAEVASGRGLRAGTSTYIRVRVIAAPSETSTATAPVTPETAVANPPTSPASVDAAEPIPAGYVASGSSTDWAYLLSGGSRWNPCRVIRWAYNPTNQGYDALADVQRAFAKIAGATGLQFRYVGATAWRYLGDASDASGFPAATADIAVGWANQDELASLKGSTVGYGGASGWSVTGADVRYRLQRGFLTLDNGHTLASGFDRWGWGQIELHEILHTLGLGHAATSDQLMYGTASWRNTKFGAGDLTGMGKVGAASGCL